jgi:hypothetical protein
MVSTSELVLIALFTGIGSGIGNPIGQWIYKKFLRERLERAHRRLQKIKDDQFELLRTR